MGKKAAKTLTIMTEVEKVYSFGVLVFWEGKRLTLHNSEVGRNNTLVFFLYNEISKFNRI